ncbi:alpha/beta fold hydrolase [Geodermatophilus chilensis]|uniref:alpha/beta fold hydrolase n=1 Tax=Geodermatophilus chilensis TaxID=2035835 RepID=UPI0018E4BDAC|nr:alpha/beta fold hydrolase [Geodermatophilus chilensis]
MTGSDWWGRWTAAVSADPENAHIGRWSRFTVRLAEDGGAAVLLRYDRGGVAVGPAGDDGADVELRAPRSAWRELVDPGAAPRRHDLLALTKAPAGITVVAGREQLLRHLRVLTLLVELAKGVAGGTAELTAGRGAAPHGTVEDVVGRYVHVRSSGADHRVYFEEGGAGPVLLALHTAGSDSRQFRHLLADRAVTDRYRVVAFDLPWHGRSLPPDRWWTGEYLLTTDRYVAIVEDFCDALRLERPVVLGCSMAGSLVLELARRSPDRWAGVIGLSGALNVAGRFQDWPLSPDLNAQQVVASWTASLMSPHSPENSRREVWWTYSQGGPGIYRGDTHFYSEDLDLRGLAGTIDTGRCPVHLLTGEYDHACTPADTAAAIAAVPGARGGTMPGIGHFPMAEDYPRFRTHLLPVLDELAAGARPGPPEETRR